MIDVAERQIQTVNLQRYRKTENGTEILCHRDKTSQRDNSDKLNVLIRFCGDESLQKANDIMRAKSCIDIVAKRRLIKKRNIVAVTDEGRQR